MTRLVFRVAGVPAPQGSKTGFVRGGRAVLVDQNHSRLKPWREAVRSTALDVAGEAWMPLDGPVAVTLHFSLPKPSSAPKRRRTWPVGARSGDLDKLVRSCFDAFTDAGIWTDDARVTELTATKDYVNDDTKAPGVSVIIQPLTGVPLILPALSRNETEGVLPL